MVKKCVVCGRDDNRIQIRVGSGICCNTCEKILSGDIDTEQALDYLWSINTEFSLAMFKHVKEAASATASEA